VVASFDVNTSIKQNLIIKTITQTIPSYLIILYLKQMTTVVAMKIKLVE
jgi:hypothetical protein